MNLGDCGWTNILDYEYEDFTLGDGEKVTPGDQTTLFIDVLRDTCEARDQPFEVPDMIRNSTMSDIN